MSSSKLQSTPAAASAPRLRQAVADFRGQMVREAAKHVFATHGIQEASLREIAKAAGCTTGAIYSLYQSKEELYADVLRDSLAAMGVRLSEAVQRTEQHTRAVLQTMLTFYEERPEDYDLSFYLFGGARPVGLRDDLNAELNDRAADVIAKVAAALQHDGLAEAGNAQELAVSAVAQVFGIALLHKTGRLRSWKQQANRLLARYLALLEPAPPPRSRAKPSK